MQLPIVRLVGRKIYKVIYEDKKWSFEEGIDYEDLHPSFSAHLGKLRDDHNNRLFEVDNCCKRVSIRAEKSQFALTRYESSRRRIVKKCRDHWKMIAKAKEKRLNKEHS